MWDPILDDKVSTVFCGWHWYNGCNPFHVSMCYDFITIGAGDFGSLVRLRALWDEDRLL